MSIPQQDADRLRDIADELRNLVSSESLTEALALVSNRIAEVAEKLADEIERWEPFWKQAKPRA